MTRTPGRFAARAVILLTVGWLGDTVGLRTAYMWCGGFALLGLPFVFLLPKSVPECRLPPNKEEPI